MRRDLVERYKLKRKEIRKRISEFEKNPSLGQNAFVGEMVFCISAANSSAKAAYRAQIEILRSGQIHEKNPQEIASILRESGVRFHNNKARYILGAKDYLFEKKNLDEHLKNNRNAIELRNNLAKNVLGFGMKEASHFLRNTGLGLDIAILDRHVLKNLVKYGAIEQVPKSLGVKKYLEIEQEMMKFSDEVNISMTDLDLLFWSEQTGEIFK